MSGWLSTHAPRSFLDLAMPESVRDSLSLASQSADPPHLLITGPSGVGKTTAWHLVARQLLGPGWKSTTHVLQARDLVRQRGAMKTFEDFLRPGGSGSADTLAGRLSLDAFDRGISSSDQGGIAPAGEENTLVEGALPISRLIVIEDADYLGSIRQAYLRRMMETVGEASRFILVARAPSRIIDALRSRTQMFRIPSTSRDTILSCLRELAQIEGVDTAEGVFEDIAYISEGNLRKAIFTLEMLHLRGLANDRSAVHTLVQSTTMQSGRHLIELALRGRVVEWRWESQGGRKKRILTGALAEIDRMMNNHGLDSDDVIHQLHDVLVGRRLSIPEELREQLLDALANCEVQLRRSSLARVPFERFLHKVAHAGNQHGLAFG